MKTTYDILINARSNRGEKIYVQLAGLFHSCGIDPRQHYIARNGKELSESIKKLRRRPPDVVVIVGGDGTISTTIRKLSDLNVTFGIIPTGTTNNFARTLGLPLDVETQVRTISNGHRTPVDLGFINDDGFVNVVGVGMSAIIARHVSDGLKRVIGRSAYTVEGIRRLPGFKPFIATISDPDSELEINYETRQVIIANGKFHAGTVIADDSGVTTGELVVFSFITAMASFYLFRRRSGRRSSFIHSTHMTMKTSRIVPYERDGEPGKADSFDLIVRNKAVNVLTLKKNI